jgi:hypothetical protein
MKKNIFLNKLKIIKRNIFWKEWKKIKKNQKEYMFKCKRIYI